MSYPYSLSVCNDTSCKQTDYNHNASNANHELVILSNQTLTEAQKSVLKKGLTFIPKPKKVNIHKLHNDVRLFMHRMKCKFEFYHKPYQTKQRPI